MSYLVTEGDFLKLTFKAFTKFLKENYFILLGLIALILPDIQLRALMIPKIFSEVYVEPATWAFSACWVFLIMFICLIMLPQRGGRIAFIVTGGLFIVLSLCQYVYFKIFDQFFWIKSIALAGEGAEYLSFALEYVDAWLIACTGVAIACLVIAAIRWKKPQLNSKKWWLIAILPILGICALHILMQPELFNDSQDDWDSWRKPRVVYSQFNDVNKSFEANGLYQFTFRDIYNTVFAMDGYGREEYEKVDEYFAQKAAPKDNEYTGIFKGKNVVAVMLEGIDTWMIDKKYTPTMSYMMENGINFTNYNAPFFGTGHTFNAEFAFNTGYYTPITAVSAVNFSANQYPYSLANVFKDAGYSVNSFHYNDSEFYNRGIMHKSFGYDKYNSFTDFGMPETVAQADSNILKNDEIYNKMVEGQPFFSFVITYSAHVPYTFNDAKMNVAKANHPELIDPRMNTEKNNCMILARDTDDFFKQLLQRLDSDGLLEDTVIVAYTDHYAYGFSDQTLLAEYKNNGIMYRVPAFVYAPGMEGIKITKPCQTIDWLPTLLNLFGLKSEGKYIGNDILDPENSGFAYFGNAAWLDDKMYYVPSDEEPDAEVKEHIQKRNKQVKELFEINDIVITGDYYSHR